MIEDENTKNENQEPEQTTEDNQSNPTETQSIDDIVEAAKREIEDSEKKAPEAVEKGKKEAETEKTKDKNDEKDAEEDPSKDDKKEDEPKIDPPYSWNKEQKKLFEELPNDVKEIISNREKEREKFLQKVSKGNANWEKNQEDFKSIKELEKLTEDRRLGLKGDDGEVPTVKEYFSRLAEIDKMSHKNPLKFVVDFAEMYNINLQELVAGNAENAFNTRAHENNVQKTESEIELRKLAAQNKQLVEYIQQQQQQQALAPIESVVVKFLESVDNEVYQDIEPTFIAQAQRLKQNGLEINEALKTAWEQVAPLSKKYVPSAENTQILENAKNLERNLDAKTIRKKTPSDVQKSYKNMSIEDIIQEAKNELE